MIAWLVTTTKEPITGFTSKSESSTASAFYTRALRLGASPDNPNGGPFTESGTTENYWSRYYLTSNGQDGKTTRSSYTEYGLIYRAWLPDGYEFSDLQEAGYNTSLITASSTSGETTTDYGTFEIQTSTTVTDIYYVNVSASSVITKQVPTLTSTTTSVGPDETKTTIVLSHEETTQPFWFSTFTEATNTYDATTTESTVTMAGDIAFATIVRANSGEEGGGAEVLYVLTNRATSLNGHSDFTNEAESGTIFTLVPSFSTSEVSSTETTSAVNTFSVDQSSGLTSSLSYVTTSSTATTLTDVSNPAIIPNGTRTISASTAVTTQSSFTYVAINAPSFAYGYFETFTLFGSANTSKTMTRWGVSWETRQRWRHTLSFHFLSSSYISSQISTSEYLILSQEPYTSTADASNSTYFSDTESYESYADEESPPESITESVTLSTSAQSGGTYESHQTISFNTHVPMPLAASIFGAGGNTSRSRWAEFGAVVGSQKGLFVTAAAPSVTVFSRARHGESVCLTQYTPVTNDIQTVNKNSITYFTTTQTTGDTSSTFTTASVTFGVAGQPSTTLDTGEGLIRPYFIQPQGGGAFAATIVDRADPGVYKDMIGGETTSFDGRDTTYATGASAPRKKWERIEALDNLASGGQPILLVRARNQIGLPSGVFYTGEL
jgi:hypothetical protein